MQISRLFGFEITWKAFDAERSSSEEILIRVLNQNQVKQQHVCSSVD